jgi:hypothetical protein
MNKQQLINDVLDKRTKPLIETLHRPVFKAKDMPISNRIINHWHENGIFLYKKEPGSWRKFSMADYIWVLLCNKLRSWNVGLQTIKKVRNQCVESIHQMLVTGVHLQLETMESGLIEDPELISTLELMKDAEGLKKELAAPEYQMFSLWLILCLEDNMDVVLRILPDENNTVDLVVLNKGKVDSEKLLVEMIQESAIFISIQSLISAFYEESRFNWEDVIPLNLTPQEKTIIGRLREKGLQSVKVVFKNNQPDRLVLKQNPKTMPKEAFNNNVLKGKFQRLELTTEDTDKMVLKVEESVKLKRIRE